MSWPRSSAGLSQQPAGAPPGPPSRLAMFTALRYRNYRFYWLGLLASVTGQQMEWVTLAWLVLQLTGSPLAIGLTGLAQATPNIALTLLGGAIADRVNRRRLLMLTQGLIALLYFLLATLVATQAVEIWHIAVFAFSIGCVRAFDHPSRQALLPLLIPREEIPNAVALGNLVWQLPRLVGPATAGVLISTAGVAPTLYLACLGFVAAVTLFGALRVDQPVTAGADGSLWRDMVEGLTFIRGNQIFAALIGLTFFDSVFGLSYQTLLPVFARDILHAGSGGYGFLQTMTAVGGIAATLIAASLAHSGHRGWQALAGAAAFGSLLVAFALSGSFPLSIGIMFAMGLANQLYMTAIATLLQLNVPDELRGRVMGVWGLTWSLVPLGGTMAGGLAELRGPQTALAMGGTLVVAAAVSIAMGLPRVRRLQ